MDLKNSLKYFLASDVIYYTNLITVHSLIIYQKYQTLKGKVVPVLN
jgi:hypothetical protein